MHGLLESCSSLEDSFCTFLQLSLHSCGVGKKAESALAGLSKLHPRLVVEVARHKRAQQFFETHELTDEPPEEYTGRAPQSKEEL